MMKAEAFSSPIGQQRWLTQGLTRQVQIDPTHSRHHPLCPVNQMGLGLCFIPLHGSGELWLPVKREVCSACVLNIIAKLNKPSHFLKGFSYGFFIKLYNLAQLIGFLSFRMSQQIPSRPEEHASNYVTRSVTEARRNY